MDSLEADDTLLRTVDTTPRVLVVLEDPVADTLCASLEKSGFEVLRGHSERLPEQVTRLRPSVVLVGETFPKVAGRQLALSLRAQGASFAVPVVAVAYDVRVPAVLRWLSVGAVDLWQVPLTRDPGARTRSLLAECQSSQVQVATMQRRLVAFARRARLSGTLVVYADTPFEGQVTFFEGELVEASLGSLRDSAALAHLLENEPTQVDWYDGKVDTQPVMVPPTLGGRATRVLVVEDVRGLTHPSREALTQAGYVVDAAADGGAGLRAALTLPYDVVVVDLDLPQLDGWGVLRALRDDVVARESAVVLVAAQPEQVETLHAARAGARAYLQKGARPKALVDAVGQLARPRALAWRRLAESGSRVVPVELRQVGAVWLLRALAELDCRGLLVATDELLRVEVSVCRGQLVKASAQLGSRQLVGVPALEAMLGSDGSGTFEPDSSLLASLDARWLFDAVDDAVRATTAQLERRVQRAVASPSMLTVNVELAQLFARLATRRQLEVLEAVTGHARSFEALVQSLGAPVEEVRAALVELLRRGVLSTEPQEG
jgi:DNA-binding response OmpR family regulator